MGPDSGFAKRLMNENGVPDVPPEEELMELARRIAKEERNLKRLKIEGIVIWCAVVLLPAAAMLVASRGRPTLGPGIAEALVMGLMTSIWVIVLFGISYLVRKHFLNQHRIEAAMLRIAAQLAETQSKPPEKSAPGPDQANL